jgi:hypothetical protein
MPSTQIHFPVTVGFKTRKQVSDESGASLKITNKIGTTHGTIFEATLTGSRENIAKAKKMIQDAEFRAKEWAYHQKLKKQSNFELKAETPQVFERKPQKSSSSKKFSSNPFTVLFEDEPEMNEAIKPEVKKIEKKETSKNQERKLTFAEMAKKQPENERKRSFPDEEAVSQPKRLKIEVMPLPKTKKLTFDSTKSWGDLALEEDESSDEE